MKECVIMRRLEERKVKKGTVFFMQIMFMLFLISQISYAEGKNSITYHLKEDVPVIEGTGDIPSQKREYYDEDAVTSIKKIIVKEGITGLGDYCFGVDYPEAVSIELPSTLKSIGKGVFMSCFSLKEIKLPSGLCEIPKDCFWECSDLEKVVIPDTVTAIRAGAFKECVSLKEMVLPDSVREIEKNAFQKCENMVKFVVPSKLSAWKNPLVKCPRLRTVVNRSTHSLVLDDCHGNKMWYVKGRRVKEVKENQTAVSKGKRFKITYRFLGGKKTGKLPTSYRYGNPIRLPLNIKKKNYQLLGWYNPKDKYTPYYCTKTGVHLVGNIRLSPLWVKYKVENVKNKTIEIVMDDSEAVVRFGGFAVRYSTNRDMKNAKYVTTRGNKGFIRNLRKNKRYYVEVCYIEPEMEADEGEFSDVWVGKRSVVIKR